ncbi:hypothetical protein JCM33374_g1918 [Metschnikowia sp. JCM 33374]|nr:hypothetical protein JCM33374_g1918 [Metschnikowia sp. JCM 33374]
MEAPHSKFEDLERKKIEETGGQAQMGNRYAAGQTGAQRDHKAEETELVKYLEGQEDEDQGPYVEMLDFHIPKPGQTAQIARAGSSLVHGSHWAKTQ